MAEFPFIGRTQPPDTLTGPHLWFVFENGRLIVVDDHEGMSLPFAPDLEALGFKVQRQHYLGTFQGQHCFVAEVEPQIPRGFRGNDLRRMLGQLDDTFFGIASRASQILEWDKTHQFCSRCGAETRLHPSDRAKQCPACGYVQYPRLSPCVITIVTRGEHILLGRQASWPGGLYSAFAGFVESGESIEESLRREVFEEAGVSVGHLRYVGSQPWPFPHQLMIGFIAEYLGGEVRVDGEEIEDAQWFHVQQLPKLPPAGSLSRFLIDTYIEEVLGPNHFRGMR